MEYSPVLPWSRLAGMPKLPDGITGGPPAAAQPPSAASPCTSRSASRPAGPPASRAAIPAAR
ncbi:MAG: hypothetical protein EBZ59_00145 [Planctomycetia bacterium]|nr:hypothetical protein [Planctomycetia bacterium]